MRWPGCIGLLGCIALVPGASLAQDSVTVSLPWVWSPGAQTDARGVSLAQDASTGDLFSLGRVEDPQGDSHFEILRSESASMDRFRRVGEIRPPTGSGLRARGGQICATPSGALILAGSWSSAPPHPQGLRRSRWVVYRSEDWGVHWIEVDSIGGPLAEAHPERLLCDGEGRVWAVGGYDDRDPSSRGMRWQVRRSLDEGVHWDGVESYDKPESSGHQVAISIAVRGSEVYVVGTYQAQHARALLRRSLDDGATWEDFDGFEDSSAPALVRQQAAVDIVLLPYSRFLLAIQGIEVGLGGQLTAWRELIRSETYTVDPSALERVWRQSTARATMARELRLASNPWNADEVWLAHTEPTGWSLTRTIDAGESWEEVDQFERAPGLSNQVDDLLLSRSDGAIWAAGFANRNPVAHVSMHQDSGVQAQSLWVIRKLTLEAAPACRPSGFGRESLQGIAGLR